ncbi:MAG TPA: pyruvate kinase, partial [Phycisphaerales bacterium]|nr:pyruvate kinase [Phycisphaerales bacterium]
GIMDTSTPQPTSAQKPSTDRTALLPDGQGIPMMPLTKIIATIGPASSDPEVIRKLIEGGVAIFRLNFSHGSLDDHVDRVRTIRQIAKELHRCTAILGDLQGPKIRVGTVPNDGLDVPTGARVRFVRSPVVASPPTPGVVPQVYTFSSTYEALIEDVEPGQRLLVNDGAVRMLVVEKSADCIDCTVTHGGLITSGKGVNLPESKLTIGSLTDRDWECVEWAVRHDLDFLALSFVRSAEDVRTLVEGLAEIKHRAGVPNMRMPIVAKIELPSAVENIDGIFEATDAIMIARGDLGVEMDLARVPVIQRRLQAASDLWGKPCIVATQMLETMISSPSPTRAEASDVAGAIFDRADAVMLSGETAVGRYPVVAVEHMRRIAEYTELELARQPQTTSAPQKLIETRYRTAALAHGAWTIAQDMDAKFIIVWSQQGGGARYLSQNNFHIPIIAATTDERAARRMQLLRGVTPILMPRPENLAQFTTMADAFLLKAAWAKPGDVCVLVAGEPIGVEGITNSLAIHSVGSPDTGFAKHGTA